MSSMNAVFNTGGLKPRAFSVVIPDQKGVNLSVSQYAGSTLLISPQTVGAVTLSIPAPSTCPGSGFEFQMAGTAGQIVNITSSASNIYGTAWDHKADNDINLIGDGTTSYTTVSFIGTALAGDYIRLISNGSRYVFSGRTSVDGGITVTP